MARDEAKWAYWTKQIKDWQASGLSRNAYCKREGLKPTTFDYWRPLITLVHAEGNAVNQSVSGNDIRLVPVKVVAPGGPMAVGHPGPAPHPVDSVRTVPFDAMALALGHLVGQPLKLKSPSGWEMNLPASIEPNWLIAILFHF